MAATRERSERPPWGSDDWAFLAVAGLSALGILLGLSALGWLLYDLFQKEPGWTMVGVGYFVAALVIALIAKLKKEGRI